MGAHFDHLGYDVARDHSVEESSRAPTPRRPPLAGWLLPLAPASLAALHVAGLLFFLNPELPFAPAPLMRAAVYYTLLLAPPSILLHRLSARWRRVAVARVVPWSLMVVAALAALGDGVHASTYAFLLPERINVQLIKSGMWLAAAAVLIFYTALLHTLHRRRYGPRSRLFVALVALGSVYAMFERRTSYRAATPQTPPITVASAVPQPRLVVVELPTATLDALLPLSRQGKLPFFAAMLDHGASARLATPTPPRPAAMLASWATGKLPYRHRIVAAHRWRAPLFGRDARVALLPIAPRFASWGLAGGEAMPLSSADLGALPVWQILRLGDQPSEVVGFPGWLGGDPSTPAVTGAASAAAQEIATAGYPALARRLDSDLARLAEVRSRAATAAAGSSVFFSVEGFAAAANATFGGFDAASFEGRRSAATQLATRVYERYLAAIDGELERLWLDLAPPRLLIVSSAYGIGAPRGLAWLGRSVLSGDRELHGTLEGAPDGLLLVRGDGVRAGVQIPDGHTVDLAPTVLYASGFPLARDLDGRVLAEAFEPAVLQRRSLSFVPSFEGLRVR